MFVVFVKTKIYIALLLTFIFSAKFVAIDANGLNMIFNGSDITLVNPFCKKHDSEGKPKNSAQLSQQDHAETQMISVSVNCSTPFQLELFSWESQSSDLLTVFDDHFRSVLSYRFLDNVSPPPRSA